MALELPFNRDGVKVTQPFEVTCEVTSILEAKNEQEAKTMLLARISVSALLTTAPIQISVGAKPVSQEILNQIKRGPLG